RTLLYCSPTAPPRSRPLPYTTLFRSVADVGPALRMLAALVGATPPADDLDRLDALAAGELAGPVAGRGRPLRAFVPIWKRPWMTDRKSTRLNSSHVKISYAVFCLKKK